MGGRASICVWLMGGTPMLGTRRISAEAWPPAWGCEQTWQTALPTAPLPRVKNFQAKKGRRRTLF